MVAKTRYRVVRPINYPAPDGTTRRRRLPGAIVDDVPEQSVGWLVAQGAIVPVAGRKRAGKGSADGAVRE